jgi:predicted aldo/keto reductase-like oxidoreductase
MVDRRPSIVVMSPPSGGGMMRGPMETRAMFKIPPATNPASTAAVFLMRMPVFDMVVI